MKISLLFDRLMAASTAELRMPRIVLLPGTVPFRGFHADRFTDPARIEFLRQNGTPLTTYKEPEIEHFLYFDQFEYARLTKRVFLTDDPSFRRGRWDHHSGIIYAPPGEEWHQELLKLCLGLTAEAEGTAPHPENAEVA